MTYFTVIYAVYSYLCTTFLHSLQVTVKEFTFKVLGRTVNLLEFELSPCSECRMLSSG